jgi:hypothetical protein
MAKKKQKETKDTIDQIVFREPNLKTGDRMLQLSDIGDNSEYLIDKLREAHTILTGHDSLITEGGLLIERVQETYMGNSKYSPALKADIADYISKAMTYFLKIEELDQPKKKSKVKRKFQKNFEKQLKSEERQSFSYASQIVDALLELGITTGAITRKMASPWKRMKINYTTKPQDEIIQDAYQSLVLMKHDLRAQYDKFHALSSR